MPAPLRHRLPGHEVTTARERDWAELENGDLLNAAERDGFDLFLTGDKNIEYQQNLAGRKISIVVLATIHWGTLRVNTAPVAAAVDRATPGSYEALPSLFRVSPEV